MPRCFSELLCQNSDNADVEYIISLITTPLDPQGVIVFNNPEITVYDTPDGYLRIYKMLRSEDGCQVACLISPKGKNTMYYPAALWHEYKKYWHSGHLVCGEEMLIHQNALLLHSSLVMINGCAVLFSGPSGAGKSTQAALWEEHLGAEILNGDRTVIMKKGETFFGGGSPWSGTSDIYSPKQAPIKGIFILKHAKENSVRRLGSESFPLLYSQTTLNSWSTGFMDKVSALYAELLEKVPVYELCCRVDKEAVTLAYNTLFNKEEAL